MPFDYCKDSRYAHLSADQVKTLFEEERTLRRCLLESPKERRTESFCWAYDELFRRCPWHPALTEKSGVNAPDRSRLRVANFQRWLPNGKEAKLLEIGCGMGELILGLSTAGYDCTGIDVSDLRIQRLKAHESECLHFHKTEGTCLPFASGTFDAAISMQLFEHLHPGDASEHLQEVSRVLKPGGSYLLETPSPLAGPGDVSRFFVDTAEGFHLKEYAIKELVRLLRENGFARVQILLRWRRLISASVALKLESIWGLLPKTVRLRHTLGLHNPVYIAYR
jgi:SAM-dependent methyltransferase